MPQKPKTLAGMGIFKPNAQNITTCLLSKLLHRFQRAYNKSKMADSRHFAKKIEKSSYLSNALTGMKFSKMMYTDARNCIGS